MKVESKRQRLSRRHQELKQLRSSHEQQWRDILDQILPYRARWSVTDHNRGEALSSTIINSTPIEALKVLAAGLMAGITSPSRPWFLLTTNDVKLREIHAVRVWLDDCTRIIREVLLRSRWYQTLADAIFRDLGAIATSAMYVLEDPETKVRCEALPVGGYWLDANARGDVDTCFIEDPMTVRQIVQEFGLENCTRRVRDLYNKGELGTVFVVVNAIMPNEEWTPGRADAKGKKFASYWWEETAPEHEDKFLRIGGYEEFPVLAPRWNNRGAREVYGRGCPGWQSVGDCKALQHLEDRKLRLVDKAADPPMRGPSALRAGKLSLLPGSMTYEPDGAVSRYEPAMQVPPGAISEIRETIREHEARIKSSFFVDLWRALLDDPRLQRATATEVEATRQEVMLQLGPLLENLNVGLLDPAIDRVWGILWRGGYLPEPPEEIAGALVRPEYISILHQAQKLTGIAGIRELLVQASTMGQMGLPQAVDKVDADAVMDELADMLGVRPELVLSEDEVTKVRQARAEQEKAAQEGEAMLKATQGVANLSQADPQKMSDLAQMVSPAAAAQGAM